MREETPEISETARSERKHSTARPLFWLVFVLSLAAGVGSAKNAQAQQTQMPAAMQTQIPGMGSSSPIPPMALPGENGPGRAFRERRIKALNSERQKELVSDTYKLLELTNQLNTQIARRRGDSFTPEQLRMLAKIEKLAKSVREKMSNPVQSSTFEVNFPLVMQPVGIP